MDVALRFLSHRSRSEAEVRRRLGRDFPESVVETTLAHLKDRGLLDDAAFAQSWRESRERNRPRSRMVLQRELYQRGVSRTVANEALEDLDEEANAMSAGQRAMRKWSGLDYQSFRSKMTAHLRRRGFNYGLASKTAEALWIELSDSADGDVDGPGEKQ